MSPYLYSNCIFLAYYCTLGCEFLLSGKRFVINVTSIIFTTNSITVHSIDIYEFFLKYPVLQQSIIISEEESFTVESMI